MVTLGDDVGVSFEHQRRAGAVAVDDGEHVRPPRRDDVDLRRPAEVPHQVGDELGGRFLVETAIGIEDARDPHEVLGERDQPTGVEVGGVDVRGVVVVVHVRPRSRTPVSCRGFEAAVGRGPATVDEDRRAGDVAARI
jgi:hypothetical protein